MNIFSPQSFMKQKMVFPFIFLICQDVFLALPIWRKHSEMPKKHYSSTFLGWKKMANPFPSLLLYLL